MNIWIFGVGHSGTTIITRQLSILGWNPGKHDHNYEDTVIKGINKEYLANDVFDHQHGADYINSLKQPWVLKDPRFVRTQPQWNIVFDRIGHFPLLIHITRSPDAMLKSHERRNEAVGLDEIVGLQEQSRYGYDNYPGPKIAVGLEKLAEAIKAFNPERP